MKFSASTAVAAIVTSILVIYTGMIYQSGATDLVLFIFCLSPLLMTWLVLTVLKADVYDGRELEPGEHWGYQDKLKEQSTDTKNTQPKLD